MLCPITIKKQSIYMYPCPHGFIAAIGKEASTPSQTSGSA